MSPLAKLERLLRCQPTPVGILWAPAGRAGRHTACSSRPRRYRPPALLTRPEGFTAARLRVRAACMVSDVKLKRMWRWNGRGGAEFGALGGSGRGPNRDPAGSKTRRIGAPPSVWGWVTGMIVCSDKGRGGERGVDALVPPGGVRVGGGGTRRHAAASSGCPATLCRRCRCQQRAAMTIVAPKERAGAHSQGRIGAGRLADGGRRRWAAARAGPQAAQPCVALLCTQARAF